MLSILSAIHCQVSSVTLNNILANYGLKAVEQDQSRFDVSSMTRHSDPALERDLFALAMQKLTVAYNDGALPRWKRLS